MPQIKIRELVARYQSLYINANIGTGTGMKNQDLALKVSDDLEAHLRAGLAVLWLYSKNNWTNFNELFDKEIAKDAEMNAKWMKAAIAMANSVTEKKLKDLIKKYGTSNAIPKGRRYSVDIESAKGGQGKGRKKSVLKVDYVASIIELLREIFDNDYQKVFVTLEKEGVSNVDGKANRGFGFR